MVSMTDLFSGHDALLSWGLAGLEALRPHVGVLVVVDVLSFSTAVDIAVSRGATVFPYPTGGEPASAYARSRGAVLASDRREGTGEAVYSLSPASLLTLPPHTRLVLPSPNGGTIAATARDAGLTLLCGCLRNARAVGSTRMTMGSRVGVVASGERWPDGSLRPALEDLLGAGAILSHLPPSSLSPDARAAVAAFHAAHLPRDITECPSGRELIGRGFGEDVDIASDVDASDTIPILRDGFVPLDL